MARHFIHIGRSKCASTTLQHVFASARAKLADAGIDYFVLGESPSIAGEPHLGDAADYAERINAHPDCSTLISDEWLWSKPSPFIEGMASALGGASPLILGYIRDYAGWTRSEYAYATMIGMNAQDFDAYLADRLPTISGLPALQRWADIFGWDSIRLRTLNAHDLTGGSVIADSLSALGVNAAVYEGADLRRNRGDHWACVEIVRALRVSCADMGSRSFRQAISRPLRLAVTSALRRHSKQAGDITYWTAEQKTALDTLYNTDISQVSELTRTPLTGISERSEAARAFLPSLSRVPPAFIKHARAWLNQPDNAAAYPEARAALATLKA